MSYSELLRKAINNQELSLTEICNKLQTYGLKTSKAHLSKLQNGKLPPAGDKINDALAGVLNIDPVVLKVAAYKEKLPKDVLEEIQKCRSLA